MPNSTKSTFKTIFPLILTTFINKTGAIGMSLLPILLVERHASTSEASITLGAVKMTTAIATLVAGWMGDWLGLRTTVLAAFACSALGLGLMPVDLGLIPLLIFGIIAQFGIAIVNGSMRMMVAQTAGKAGQKEALGWMRTVNNLGQVISYGLAAAVSGLGAQVLIWFDALTSAIAFVLGNKTLPSTQRANETAPSPSVSNRALSWRAFGCGAAVLLVWTFQYELFISGIAGRVKIVHGEPGLQLFSGIMMINTIFCALLSVGASKFFQDSIRTLAGGTILFSLGLVLCVEWTQDRYALFAGAFFITLGEILYGVFSQLLLIRSIPDGPKQNRIYATSLFVINLGRMLAAAISFPLLVHTQDLTASRWVISAALGISLMTLAVGHREFRGLT